MGLAFRRPAILETRTVDPNGIEQVRRADPVTGRVQITTVDRRRRSFFGGKGKRKTRRSKTIRMKKSEYLREHHHLFRVLQNPTRRALNAELRAQKRELKERGLKG